MSSSRLLDELEKSMNYPEYVSTMSDLIKISISKKNINYYTYQ